MEIVIHHRGEGLEWFSTVSPATKRFIYSDVAQSTGDDGTSPPAGGLCSTYLTHIIKEYDNLSGPLVFTAGTPTKGLLGVLDSLQGISGFKEFGARELFFDDEGLPHFLGTPLLKKGCTIGGIYRELFSAEPPQIFYCRNGSSFVVEASIVRSHPVDFYEKCLELASELDAVEPGVAYGDLVFGRLWHQIFRTPTTNTKSEILPGMNSPLALERLMLLGPYVEAYLKARMREDKTWGYRILNKANEALG